LNPTRYPVNLFRDDEFKTIVKEFKHRLLMKGLKDPSGKLPEMSKIGDGGTGSATKAQKINPENIINNPGIEEAYKAILKNSHIKLGVGGLMTLQEINSKETAPQIS
jgi:hypothetical protein